MIITIDGPAGSGKSTAARKLAARLGIPYLDTGAMYRAVTLAALEDGVDWRDEDAKTRVADEADFELDCGPTHVRVTMRGRDVSEEIRSMRVNEHTRFMAASPGVRAVLVEKQRELGKKLETLATEGRDQGSVVFPEAEFKFFMDASAEKRAERRLIELQSDGEDASYEEVLANMRSRDRTDSQRAVGPLVIPNGAIVIETSALTIGQVVERLLDELRRGGVDTSVFNRNPASKRTS